MRSKAIPSGMKYFGLVTILLFLEMGDANGACEVSQWYDNTDPQGPSVCPSGTVEAWRDIMGGKTKETCCPPEELSTNKPESTDCSFTNCIPSTFANENSICDYSLRYANGRKLESNKEEMRESCSTGVYGLCCPPNSTQSLLQALNGVEPHEFPHMVKLDSDMGSCGGTIYNKRFIITAAHCIIHPKTGEVTGISGSTVLVGTNMAYSGEEASGLVYKVSRLIPHPGYSMLKGNPGWDSSSTRAVNDIAILELERDIQFGEGVKSLELAQEGFDPLKFANTTIMPGWGRTVFKNVGEMGGSWLMQKTDIILHPDEICFGNDGYWGGYENQGVICAGGIVNGKYSQIAGEGNSGGPLISRGPDGTPVHYGLGSMSPSYEKCEANNDEKSCYPTLFTKVPHFRAWIKDTAGEQDPNTFYKPFLYGGPVQEGKYRHQVHITSNKGGKPCGGTLISRNVVVTAAQCVVDVDAAGKSYDGIKVTTGLNALNGKGEDFAAQKVVSHPDFQRVGPPVDIAKQGNRVIITENLYRNDIAVIRLDRNVNNPESDLAQLPENYIVADSGMEVAFPRDPQKYSELRAREFKLLGKKDCQTRFSDLLKLGEIKGNIFLDDNVENVICGVERYSGGSTCDRELGGGLICQGRNGQDVLWGVQSFRLCEFSVPNRFVNVAMYKDWINKVVM